MPGIFQAFLLSDTILFSKHFLTFYVFLNEFGALIIFAPKPVSEIASSTYK